MAGQVFVVSKIIPYSSIDYYFLNFPLNLPESSTGISSSQMKIMQVANKFPYPPKDGGSIATFSLARSLAELGNEVTILAMNTSKHFTDIKNIPGELQEMIRFEAVPVDTSITLGGALKNLFFSKMPYNAERFISPAFDQKLRQLLKENDFDIIQLEGLYLVPYIDTIRKYSQALLVMRAHNIEHEIWERSVKRQKGPRKIYIRHLSSRIRKIELEFLNAYDAVLPITERDGKMMKHLGCRLPMKIVPTGINSGELQPDHSKLDFPSVFHIGALDWLPNQEGILWFLDNVWPKILDKKPQIKFYLAGRNAPGFFREMKYPNMEFIGEVDDAYKFMRAKAIMIVPVLSGSGMRIKIIEGMALGKSIVTTSVGTEGIATSHGENILIADTAEEYAGEILKLLDNYELFREIGEKATTFVRQNYDNLAISASLVSFYKELLK